MAELAPDDRSITIQDWSTNGQVYLDFINIEQVRIKEDFQNPTAGGSVQLWAFSVVLNSDNHLDPDGTGGRLAIGF